jgi:hypothetical protein
MGRSHIGHNMTISKGRIGRIFYQIGNEISSTICLIFDIRETLMGTGCYGRLKARR